MFLTSNSTDLLQVQAWTLSPLLKFP